MDDVPTEEKIRKHAIVRNKNIKNDICENFENIKIPSKTQKNTKFQQKIKS